MKKIAFVLSLMLMLNGAASAQDVVTLRQGKEMKVHVKDVTPTEVRYANADNPDGPTYSIAKKDVVMIQYQNGAVEEFKTEKQEADEQKAENARESNPNSVWDADLWTNQRPFGATAFANVGGFFFTGMQLGGELRWRRFAIDGFFKLAGAGAMNQSYLCNTDNCGRADDLSGHGGGWTLKLYLPLNDKGASLHLGIINETAKYNYTRSREIVQLVENWNTAVKSTGFGGGYSRHALNGFYWGMSGYFGMSVFSGDVERNWGNGTVDTGNAMWSRFFGIIEASIGWEFAVKH